MILLSWFGGRIELKVEKWNFCSRSLVLIWKLATDQSVF